MRYAPARERGATTVYFALFTLMALGFLVMAVDFGRLYVIQGELQTAAESAALAAATGLTGAANVLPAPHDQAVAAFDSTTGNDNRFNLRMNQIGAGAAGLAASWEDDYFSNLTDAQANTAGSAGTASAIDWASGLYSKYVRVQITAQAPVVFVPLLNRVAGS
ncbi:MAG TPA: pilus assembly protein TadG-related protein, partial [Terriglobia bacterium]|nr:pilus assembly protein TadG-related protein [Terriglobia bacterium]